MVNKKKLHDSEKEYIAKRLRDAREALELSQTALAKESGLSRSSVVHYENGNSVPGGIELLKLGKALKVSPNYVLTGTDEFEAPQGDDYLLAVDDEELQITRTAMVLSTLDRRTRNHIAALVLDLARSSKTEKEFAGMVALLKLMEPHLNSVKKNMVEQVEGLDWEELGEQAAAIPELAEEDDES